jgi:hypothetical protein
VDTVGAVFDGELPVVIDEETNMLFFRDFDRFDDLLF